MTCALASAGMGVSFTPSSLTTHECARWLLSDAAEKVCTGGVSVELSGRNQPRVTDGDPDGDGSVDVDESALEQRTEQGRLPGGRAQQDALHDHHQLLQVGRRARLLSCRRGRLWRRKGRRQRLSRRAGRGADDAGRPAPSAIRMAVFPAAPGDSGWARATGPMARPTRR